MTRLNPCCCKISNCWAQVRSAFLWMGATTRNRMPASSARNRSNTSSGRSFLTGSPLTGEMVVPMRAYSRRK